MCQVAWQIFFLFLVVFAASIWYQARIISIFRNINLFVFPEMTIKSPFRSYTLMVSPMQVYYISTARELARMVPVQQAPILHHFSESIAGATVIRSFKQEDRFWKTNVDLIDNYSRVAFHNSGTMEWLCVRINFLFNLVFFLLLIILVSLPRSAIDPSKHFTVHILYVLVSRQIVLISL